MRQKVGKVSLEQIDEMTDFAILRASQGPDGARQAVAELAARWPDVTGLQLVFVMVSAASAIEGVFDRTAAQPEEGDQIMRNAALLAVDLFALQQRGNFAPTGRDLLRYWDEVDPYFSAEPRR